MARYRRRGYRRTYRRRGRALARTGDVKPTATLKRFIRNQIKSTKSPEEFRETHVKLWHTERGYAKWFPLGRGAEMLRQKDTPWTEFKDVEGTFPEDFDMPEVNIPGVTVGDVPSDLVKEPLNILRPRTVADTHGRQWSTPKKPTKRRQTDADNVARSLGFNYVEDEYETDDDDFFDVSTVDD